MSVGQVVQGAARDGVRTAVIWGLQRQGDVAARLMDPQVTADPYPAYRTVRERGPFVATRMGAYTARHDVVERVLRDPAFGHGTASSAQGQPRGLVAAALLPPVVDDLIDPVGPESIIGMDPPDHTRLRRLVAKVFTPRAIEALRPRVEALADQLLGPAARRGSFDLMTDFAGALPVLAICEVLGIPVTDRQRFKAWGNDVATALDLTTPSPGQRRAQVALRALHAYFADLFAARRRDPGDDLLSELLQVEEQGDSLTGRELMATCLLLLLAGFETTVNLLGNGTLALLREPEQLALLREDPARIPGAVEELLRYDAPVQLTGRLALRDAEVGGVELPAGTFVVTLLGGANRDPAVFPDPDTLDVLRPNARRHLSFAAGPHHCLGAALARLEGEVGLAALLEHAPGLSLAGTPRRRPTFVLRGLSSLPVTGGRAVAPPAAPAA